MPIKVTPSSFCFACHMCFVLILAELLFFSEPRLLERRHYPQGDYQRHASGQREVPHGLGVRTGAEDEPVPLVRRGDRTVLRSSHHYCRYVIFNIFFSGKMY